jgi:hypothetical protein
MTDIDMIRQFISREDLNNFEQKLRNKCINAEQALNTAIKDLQDKDQEVKHLRGVFDGLISFIFELESDRQIDSQEKREE